MFAILPRVLPLLVLSAPLTGLAEPAPSPAETDLLDRLLDTIELEQSQNGPNSKELIEPLTGLVSLYQADGDHRLAAAAIERALQVVRVNYGVHSLEQVPLIRRSIVNEEAIGDAAGAWKLEQELLELVHRHPDDLRTVPILREIAASRMDLLERYTAGEIPPQIVLGCYYRPQQQVFEDPGSCTSGRRGDAVRSILLEAQQTYLDAVATLVRNERYSSPELRDIELETVRNAYLYRSYLVESALYEFGRKRLRNLVEYDELRSAPRNDRIEALVRLADWDLIFSQNGLALDEYAQIYSQLEQDGVTATSTEDVFSPAMPVVLPSFLPNPLVSNEAEDSIGHIDVAFEITKFGIGRQVEIIDATMNATDSARNHLARLIKGSRFRPIMTDGQIARKSAVVMRYYIDG